MDIQPTDGQSDKPDYIKTIYQDPPLVFRNFSNDQISEFLALTDYVEYEKSELILKEAEEVEVAYLVVGGRVSVWKESIQLITMSEGDFIGETFVFPGNNRIANVIADDHCSLLRFERKKVLAYLRKKPRKLTKLFTRNLILIQENKMSHMNKQLITLKKKLQQFSDSDE